MTDPDSRTLFFIGAYRDNEVNETHPLMLTLDVIQKGGTIVNHISLMPLNLSQINRLVSDSLNCEQEKSLPLAKLVFSKTNGNPFFTGEFLKSLYKEKQIEFDHKHFKWKWSTEQIHALNITDNVLELVANKIQNLTGDLQHVLKLAACTGNQFELKALSIVCEQSQREIALLLRGALAQGFIVPLGDSYKSVEFDLPEPADGLTVEYRFSHDRIQQAVYSLIPETERSSVHLKMGKQLLKMTPPDMLEHKIFDITNQLNNGIELINLDSEKYELARLNLIAGKKAKAAAAYEHAFKYLNAGIKLVTSQQSHALNKTSQTQTFWQTNYNLALELHVETAEAAYLCNEFDKMEKLIQVVFDQARTLLDKVKAYEIKIQAFYAQNKMTEAVNTALSAMKLLGINFPKKPNKLNVLLAFIRTKFALTGKNIEDLENLSQMTDPNMQAALRIIVSSVLPAHYAAPQLFPLFVFKAVYLAVKYGAAPFITFAFAGYGLILCGVMGDTESGYKFGKLAVDLLERPDAKEFKAKTLVAVNSFIIHWKDHLRKTQQPFLDAYQYGLEAGDLEFAAISLSCYSRHSYFAGRELPALEQEVASYWDAIDRLKQETALNFQSVIRQVVLNLMSKGKKPYSLIGEWYNEETMLPIHLAANDKAAIFIIYLHKIILNYLFYRFHGAVKNATEAKKYIDGVMGRPHVPIFYFYNSLSRLAVFPDAQKPEQKRILKKVAANQKKMKKWAHHAPMNYLHKFFLVEAERCRILGEDGKAIEYYDQSISLAGKHEYINEEALANELAAKFYLTGKKTKIAEKYMTDARYCYLRWGASAKVKDLDNRYAELLDKMHSEVKSDKKASNLTVSSTINGSGEDLDLISLMKASQAISGEIVLSKLLDKLIRIVIENTGAQKGFLMLKSGDNLLVEAEGTADKGDVIILNSIPVDKTENFSVGIVNYVSRTHKAVILDDPVFEGPFKKDPYILNMNPKSILCEPLLYKSELIGILYLENNQTKYAFSSRHLKAIRLLSSRIAVSLENARLYESLKDQTIKIKSTNLKLNSEIEQRKKAETELTRYRDHLEELVEQRTKELQESRRSLAHLKGKTKKGRHFKNIIGNSQRMLEIYTYIEYLTNISTTVLITGESGTGKELVAQALHRAGNRKAKPFISVNCSALSESVLESELFGHVKGAFTGAENNKIGRFEKAGNGTIFLDEIGDISLHFQKRLLRILQEKEFEQVGGTTSMKMKARVLAATNQNILEKVRQGEFREDLYYRLKVVELNLPPLRDRKEDIPLLISHFLTYFNHKLGKKITDVSKEVLKHFIEHHWPGNIRELKNTIEHICVFCKNPAIMINDLPNDFRAFSRQTKLSKNHKNNPNQSILQALETTRWNKTHAAQLLGISRRTLYRKLEKQNIMTNKPPV
jgi:predicted ATPase/GAF domain-containing protein